MDHGTRLRITLVAREGCGLCDESLALLNRLALDYPLEIISVDIDKPGGAAIAALSGILFTPAVLIGSDVVVSGRISERRLRGELARQFGRGTPSHRDVRESVSVWRQRGQTLFGWLTRTW